MIQRLIGGYVFRYNFVDGYKEKTFLLEKKIAEIYDFRILNDTVSQEISKIFRVHHCCVVLLSENDVSVSSIRKYFESGYSDNILINDMVFLEQRKDMALDIGKIREEIEMLDAYIIFPLMHNDARCI